MISIRFRHERVRAWIDGHLDAHGTSAQGHPIELDGRSFCSVAPFDDDLWDPGAQFVHRRLDFLLEAFAHRLCIRQRQLVTTQRRHQLTQVLLAQCDVVAHLRGHLDLSHLAERLEGTGPVASLLQLDPTLKLCPCLRQLRLSLRQLLL